MVHHKIYIFTKNGRRKLLQSGWEKTKNILVVVKRVWANVPFQQRSSKRVIPTGVSQNVTNRRSFESLRVKNRLWGTRASTGES